jgi:uncharacterized protein (TIGR02996 family)
MLEEDIVAAIRAAPNENRARLAYAEWLLERGDPRGELIQVQCQMAQCQRPDPTLRARERRALTAVEAARPAWAAEWPPPYRLGFAEKLVVVDAATLLANATEIQRQHPLAELFLADGSEVVVSGDGSRYALLTKMEEGAGCTLDVGTEWTTTTVRVFERDGREVHCESFRFEHAYTSSSDWESGEVIESIALSADGRTLSLSLSEPGRVTRSV